MASLNKVLLIGNLGRDPETRYMPDGGAITNISIATTSQWKDKSGEKQESTEWHRIAFFGLNSTLHAQSYLSSRRSKSTPAATSSVYPTTPVNLAFTYLMSVLSVHVRRDYLLDASQPQGRAF